MDTNINGQFSIKKYVIDILQSYKLAVLATESDGQPYASLITITPFEGFRQIIFATYRNTRKFKNIFHNGRVSVLIQGEDLVNLDQKKGFALTAFGHAQEVGINDLENVRLEHLNRHPDIESFMNSGDVAIISIKVEAFQVVRAIDDVIWWPVVAMTEL